ncbi:hypothetical protein BDR05DRAFT_874260, partial [Suillus weaverae]
VSFSPDESRMVSGYLDKTVAVGCSDDAASSHGQPLGEPLRGHTNTVSLVSFLLDGTRITSGSWNRTVRVWYAAIG